MRNELSTSIVEISLSRGKLLRILMLCLMMTVLSALLFLPAAHANRFSDGIRYAIGAIGITFFGFATFKALRKLGDASPGLLISPQGIAGEAIRPRDSVLSWDKVTGVTESSIQKQRFVTVLLRDPSGYIAQGFGGFAAATMSANLKLTGSPVNISANTLAISHTELLKLLRSHFERYAGHR